MFKSSRKMTPVLTTERLTLRPISLADAPAVQRGIDNWAVIRELSTAVPWPYPAGGAAQFIREVVLPKVATGETHCWVLALGPDADAIGVIEFGFARNAAGNRGFWLAEPCWGRGLMTEAVIAMQDWLFFELGLDEIFVCNAIDNRRSRRIKEKTGAEWVGELEIPHHHGSSRAERWRLTREAWAAHRANNEHDATTYAKLAGFDDDWRDGWWNQDFLELIAKRTAIHSRERLLDVGCGVGHWGLRLLALAAPSSSLVGVDREVDFLDGARARATARDLGDRSTFTHATAEHLPFPDAHFDMVTCQTVLMHVADPRLALAEMLRVLKPDGLLLVAEPDNVASTISASRGHPPLTIEQSLARVKLRMVCSQGKIALGHGDDNIGGLLPGLFGETGLLNIEVWNNDRASALFKPYADPRQQSDLTFLEGAAAQSDTLCALELERFVAGGGEPEEFSRLWEVELDFLHARMAAAKSGTMHCAGGHVHYLVAGTKPNPA